MKKYKFKKGDVVPEWFTKEKYEDHAHFGLDCTVTRLTDGIIIDPIGEVNEAIIILTPSLKSGLTPFDSLTCDNTTFEFTNQ